MTLGENKKICLALIEEYSPTNQYLTDDNDIKIRLNLLYNTSYFEMAGIKKYRKTEDIYIDKGTIEQYEEYSLPSDLYQLDNVKALDSNNIPLSTDYYIIGNDIYIKNNQDATYKLSYFAYPTQITESTPDSFELEIDPDVQNILPYAVASDILKSDPSANYIAFEQKYNLKKNMDTRISMPTITLDTKYTI